MRKPLGRHIYPVAEDNQGRIVTVRGPTGSPGRSTVAAALAGALAPAGRVVLVDADLQRGALGPLLGLTGGGTIASAATLPAPPGAPCRPRDLQAHRAGFTLLRGVPGPAQSVALDPNDLAALLARLRASYDLVLVDVGAALPPREFGNAHLAALRAADLVLVVGALTALGLSDLLLQTRVLAERLDPRGLGSDAAGPPAWCVLNKGHGGLLRHGPGRVTAETGLPVAVTLPLDTRNVVAAEEARQPLTVARPHSPAAALIMGLAVRLQRALATTSNGAGAAGTRLHAEKVRRLSGEAAEAVGV
jgi:MinD-like ATPase involved in chromosome partitioning or flagellar assembly